MNPGPPVLAQRIFWVTQNGYELPGFSEFGVSFEQKNEDKSVNRP